MGRIGPLEKQAIVAQHRAGVEIAELAARYDGQVSKGHLYRILNPLHAAEGAKGTNSRRGTRPALDAIPAESQFLLAAMIYHRQRTAEQAVTDLELNGKLLAGQVHPGTVNRWLRVDNNLTRRQALKTGTQVTQGFERKRANELHQFDATRAAIYYIDTRGDVCYEPDSEKMKIRAKEGKTPVNIFALIDDHSRAAYLRAYDRESVENWFDFLHRAWSPKADGNPLFGLPLRGYTDNTTTLFANQVGQRLFDHGEHIGPLGVRLMTHVPHQPWSKGKVEKFLQTVQTEETGLQRENFADLADFNLWLGKVASYYGNKVHSSTREAPFARWSRSLVENDSVALRLPPSLETWNHWILRSAERVIDAYLRIRIEDRPNPIQLPHSPTWIKLRGKKVLVLYKPNCHDDVVIIAEDLEYTVAETPAKVGPWVNTAADLRTAGEIVRDGTKDVDLSGIDTTLRLTANAKQWPQPKPAIPFQMPVAAAAQAALAAAVASQPVSRLGVIDRLRGAGLVGEVLNAADCDLVDSLCPTGSEIEAAVLQERIRELREGQNRQVG